MEQRPISRRTRSALFITERELSQLAAGGERETVRIISTLVGLSVCCGLGQTALRKLRQRAQLVEHKFFERVVRHFVVLKIRLRLVFLEKLTEHNRAGERATKHRRTR